MRQTGVSNGADRDERAGVEAFGGALAGRERWLESGSTGGHFYLALTHHQTLSPACLIRSQCPTDKTLVYNSPALSRR